MQTSLLFALASALLSQALPTVPNNNVDGLHPRAYTAPISYPAGYNASTCPSGTGSNPWANHPSKRATQTSPLCQQIASYIFQNSDRDEDGLFYMPEVTLLPSATYVVSWTCSEELASVQATFHNADGSIAGSQSQGPGGGAGQMTLDPGSAVSFSLEIGPWDFNPVNGEVALYLLANGHANPDASGSGPPSDPGSCSAAPENDPGSCSAAPPNPEPPTVSTPPNPNDPFPTAPVPVNVTPPNPSTPPNYGAYWVPISDPGS